jgi:hypothetical protein
MNPTESSPSSVFDTYRPTLLSPGQTHLRCTHSFFLAVRDRFSSGGDLLCAVIIHLATGSSFHSSALKFA